jgi:iron(III) transport system permease protein
MSAAEVANAGHLPSTGRARVALSLGAVLCTVVLAIVAFLVVYPVLLLIIHSFEVGPFGRPTTWGVENWVRAFTQPDLAAALWNTVSLAVTRQAIALVVAVPICWLIARTDLPGRNWLEFGFWVCVFLPQLTVTLGWIMVFDNHNGLANQLVEKLPWVEKGPFDIFTWWGIVATHLLSGAIAIKVMLLTPAFRNLDASLEEASLASGASSMATLFRVVVPLVAPALLVITILSTIRAMEAFETELILGAPAQLDVFSTKIYRIATREPPEYGVATAMSMVILAMVLPLILFQQRFISRRSHATISGKFRGHIQPLGAWRWPLFGIIFTIVCIMTILPVALVITGTFMNLFGYFTIATPWTMKHWMSVLSNPTFTNALWNTVIIAGGTAILGMVVFTIIAYIIVRTKYAARGTLDMFVWVPSTVPGIILGLGFLWLFLGTPFLRPLYGTTWLLILVTALGSITLGTQLVKSTLVQLGSELEEASWASGASWRYTLRRVVLPLIAPAIAVIGVVAFSAAARTTGTIALLATNANQPLSMLQLNLMADNNYGAASVVGVFLLVLTVGVALVARTLGLKLGVGGR